MSKFVLGTRALACVTAAWEGKYPVLYHISYTFSESLSERRILPGGKFLWSLRVVLIRWHCNASPPRVYSLGSQSTKDKPLTLCKFCSAVPKTLLCYQHCSASQSQFWNKHCRGYSEGHWRIPSRPVHFKRLSLLSNTDLEKKKLGKNSFPLYNCHKLIKLLAH